MSQEIERKYEKFVDITPRKLTTKVDFKQKNIGIYASNVRLIGFGSIIGMYLINPIGGLIMTGTALALSIAVMGYNGVARRRNKKIIPLFAKPVGRTDRFKQSINESLQLHGVNESTLTNQQIESLTQIGTELDVNDSGVFVKLVTTYDGQGKKQVEISSAKTPVAKFDEAFYDAITLDKGKLEEVLKMIPDKPEIVLTTSSNIKNSLKNTWSKIFPNRNGDIVDDPLDMIDTRSYFKNYRGFITMETQHSPTGTSIESISFYQRDDEEDSEAHQKFDDARTYFEEELNKTLEDQS